METLKRLQTQIKTRRKAANISQADVASRLGIARNTYGQYETGARRIRVEHLPELAKLFGCTIDDLFKNNAQAWIPVSERLPERAGMAVLVVAENTFGQKHVVKAFTDYTGRNGFLTNEKEYDLIWDTAWKVTHWMPLPKPPKENDYEQER